MTIQETMLEKAKQAMQFSYSPYSNFKVGACIRSSSGKYYSGSNIENASYPISFCAEATAIAHMIMAGDKVISDVLVIGESEIVLTPCGMCRQRIREFSDKNKTQIHCCDRDGIKLSLSLAELLPYDFGPQHLEST